MNSRLNQVGFSQRVRLEWFEATSSLVLAGTDDSTICETLRKMLEDKLSIGRDAKRGSREKVITILMKVWVRPPGDFIGLRNAGLSLLRRLSPEHHLAIHWGMVMAVYPFWASVASHVGRLLKLQGTVSHRQVRRRIVEKYGQRSTVRDAVRRVLRSMVDWGVLRDVNIPGTTKASGTYTPGLSLSITDEELISWLAEALLHTRSGRAASLETVLEDPALFPFRLAYVPAVRLVSVSERLEILHQGFNKHLLVISRPDHP